MLRPDRGRSSLPELCEGGATEGERAAAGAARERLEARLRELRAEQAVEFRFSLDNAWSRRLFIAVLRRHGLERYRHHGQRRTTVMCRVSKRYCDEVLWPEFSRLDETLQRYLDEVADRVIAAAVHGDATHARVVAALPS